MDKGAPLTGQALVSDQAASRLAPSGFDPSRNPYQPRPNCHTMATFEEIIAWAQAVEAGEWTWLRNSGCKYVTIKLDTRAGAYRIDNRDGKEISIDDLTYQFSRDSDRNPTGGDGTAPCEA